MKTCRVHCELCGDVTMFVALLTLRLCIDAPELSSYWYECPQCGQRRAKPDGYTITDEVRVLLLSAGARCVPFFVPAEMFERHDGPPLTSDDLLDFHEELERA